MWYIFALTFFGRDFAIFNTFKVGKKHPVYCSSISCGFSRKRSQSLSLPGRQLSSLIGGWGGRKLKSLLIFRCYETSFPTRKCKPTQLLKLQFNLFWKVEKGWRQHIWRKCWWQIKTRHTEGLVDQLTNLTTHVLTGCLIR